jgi:hypothetical protein
MLFTSFFTNGSFSLTPFVFPPSLIEPKEILPDDKSPSEPLSSILSSSSICSNYSAVPGGANAARLTPDAPERPVCAVPSCLSPPATKNCTTLSATRATASTNSKNIILVCLSLLISSTYVDIDTRNIVLISRTPKLSSITCVDVTRSMNSCRHMNLSSPPMASLPEYFLYMSCRAHRCFLITMSQPSLYSF